MLFKKMKGAVMNTVNLPKFSTILLDTNFFIDFYGHEDKHKDLFRDFKELEITLVSIDLIKCEFIRSKTQETTYP